jgi:hypothetical protein
MTFQEIIDFLWSLLNDEEAQAAFAQDPQASLAAAGLEDVTVDDIRDASLQLRDSGAVSGPASSGSYSGGDPVREIEYTTRNYTVEAPAEITNTFVDQRTFNVDDRDITLEDNDTTIVNDSFNSSSDDDVLAIDNSDDDILAISQDNDVVTNDVTAIQVNDNDVVNNDNDVIDIVDNDVINEAPEPEPEPSGPAEAADAPEAEAAEPADPLAEAAV